MPKPPVIIDLDWNGRLQFTAHTGKTTFVLDSSGVAGPSPVDSLAAALAGCMAMDVAHILTKGRHAFRSLRVRLVAERAPDDPHRILGVTLHFAIAPQSEPLAGGAAPAPLSEPAVERAISLSHDKYCSVWHSLRQDIAFQVTFDVVP
jgi:putative redox protein